MYEINIDEVNLSEVRFKGWGNIMKSEKVWAAVDNDKVLEVITMRKEGSIPKSLNFLYPGSQNEFLQYRKSSREKLAQIGTVKSGKILLDTTHNIVTKFYTDI